VLAPGATASQDPNPSTYPKELLPTRRNQ